MTTGRHRRGKVRAEDADRSAGTTAEEQPAADAVDPDRLSVAEADMSSDEHNRDAGAAPQEEGIPEVADESTPSTGEVPEPERPIVPTDEPTGTTAYGTTAREQADRERLENRLAAEEPDTTEEQPTGQSTERPDVGGPGIHVEDEPS